MRAESFSPTSRDLPAAEDNVNIKITTTVGNMTSSSTTKGLINVADVVVGPSPQGSSLMRDLERRLLSSLKLQKMST